MIIEMKGGNHNQNRNKSLCKIHFFIKIIIVCCAGDVTPDNFTNSKNHNLNIMTLIFQHAEI